MALIHSYFVDIFLHRKLLHESAKRTNVTIYHVKKYQQNTSESMQLLKQKKRTSICHVILSIPYKEKEASISFHLSSNEGKSSLVAVL